MNVLYLITARGGSKGVPQKNIREISGLPLIAYKIISAQKTTCAHKRIILSTDSEEIVAIGRKYGSEVPFMRPAELATDTATSKDVILHAMNWVDQNDPNKYDLLFLLEPSSPFGTYQDFQKALDLFSQSNVENVVSVKQTEPNTVFIVSLAEDGSLSSLAKKLLNLKKVRRQDFKPEYTPSGALYCTRWDNYKQNETFYTEKTFPLIQNEYYAIEIDALHDLEYAQFLVDKKYIDMSFWK